MAEALNSLFKAECIRNPVMRPKGGRKSVGDVEISVAEYTEWFNLTDAFTARSAGLAGQVRDQALGMHPGPALPAEPGPTGAGSK